ncbi:MAG: DUF6584 family protein [Fimbriimonadaceae bacterium]
MPRDQTLLKIEEDIAEGRLGIARDRLRGLIQSLPDDLKLREKMGDINWALGYPVEAGCFWFMVKEPTEQQSEAIARFIKSCNGDSDAIAKRLNFRGQVSSNVSDEIRLALERHRVPSNGNKTKKTKDTAWAIGCGFVVVFLMYSVCRTLVELYHFVFG